MLTADNAIYSIRVKPPKYNSGVPIIALDYRNMGRYLRMHLPQYSKQDHITNALQLAQRAKRHKQEWSKVVDKAAMATWGRKFQFYDYKISGIGSDEFSDRFKNLLIDHAWMGSKSLSAAYAHYSAAGKKLDSARKDLNKIAGV